MGNFEYEFNTGTSGGGVRRKWFGWVGEAYIRPKYPEGHPYPRITEETQRTPWRMAQSRALDDVIEAHDRLVEKWAKR